MIIVIKSKFDKCRYDNDWDDYGISNDKEFGQWKWEERWTWIKEKREECKREEKRFQLKNIHTHKKGSEKWDWERRMVDAKSIMIYGNERGREIGKSKMGKKQRKK